MNERYPYLSDYNITSQENGLCGQACVIVSSSIVNKKPIQNRSHFLELSSQVETAIEKKHCVNFPATMKALLFGAEELKLIPSVRALDATIFRKRLNVFGITRIAWRSFRNPQLEKLHRFYDDEHYVLIYKKNDSSIFFWEPSFSFNCVPIDNNFSRINFTLAECIGGGLPFWEMSVREFLERNQKATIVKDWRNKIVTFKKTVD
jgi:hypothetical protein